MKKIIIHTKTQEEMHRIKKVMDSKEDIILVTNIKFIQLDTKTGEIVEF